jgi:hypothetical protein
MSSPRPFLAVPALLLAIGCVPVQPLRLSRPATISTNTLSAEVEDVAASGSFLVQRGGRDAVLAATITVTSRTPAILDVDRAVLVMTDPGGELPDVTLAAWTSGTGPAPRVISPSKRPVAMGVRPGEVLTMWVAFRAEERLREADVPRRILLRIPVTDSAVPVEIILAEPSTGRPRWELPPVLHASYAGVSASGTFDEASFGILRTSGRNVAGPFVIGPSFSLGFRGGKLRDERETTIACCDLGVSFDLSAPILRGPEGAVGPYLGYHGLFVLEDGRHDKAPWHGPAIGLQLFSRPIDPRTAGALPVRTSRTPLGYASTTVAYVHWFRRGDPAGSPGFVLLLEHTLPEL